MADPFPSLSSAACYVDPRAALAWLERAFGFEVFMLIEDAEGNIAHSEMRFGNSAVMVGSEWSADHKSPRSIGGKNTQTVHIQIDTDIDAHCERARAAGAEIIMEPQTQF
ncbi:VOC family protein, partial [Phenylobacterium sp.]|uniref:VOC family protein n=1 Tax=Phenylobacterium sp. TaxID=1871053 RepID=UPI001204D681